MTLRRIRFSLVLICLLSFLAATAAADDGHPGCGCRPAKVHRFSFSLSGGLSLQERSLIDAKAELQFSFTRRVRLGLGAGFIGSGGRRDFWPRPVEPLAVSPMTADGNDEGSPLRRDRIRGVVPVSLDAYYVLPLGHRWGVYTLAGGSYYFGDVQSRDGRGYHDAWGAQAGLGVEYRFAGRFSLIAEGMYRWVESSKGHRFDDDHRIGPTPVVSTADGSDNELRFPVSSRPSPLDLKGFSVRLGARVGF
jgi:hypothetical protein